jgi:arylsulfatase A-like enzyme
MLKSQARQSRISALVHLIAHCLSGLLAGGTLHALLYPASLGFGDLGLKFLMIQAGNLFGTIIFLPFCLFLARYRQRNIESAAFNAGLGLALGAFAGAWWFELSGRQHAILEAGLPVSLWIAMQSPLQMSERMSRAKAGVFIVVMSLLMSPAGRQHVEFSAGYDIDQAPALPQVDSVANGTKPDVLLISIDTLRADALSKTLVPTINALAAQSLVAPYALAPSPVTLPSHISMVTGESPLTHAAYTNLGHMPTDSPTLAEAFHDGGYRTLATAANSLLNTYTGFDRGFEVLVNIEGGSAHKERCFSIAQSGRRMVWYAAPFSDLWSQRISFFFLMRRYSGIDNSQEGAMATAPIMGDLALNYLDQLYADDAPFFYFLHFMDPHVPYFATDEFLGKLNGDRELPDAFKSYTSGSLNLCRTAMAAIRNNSDSASQAHEVLQILRDRYHEELMMVDAELSRVLARVKQSQRPTVILFTSDHGEHFGENGKMLHGDSVHAANIRVPFMLSVPGVSAGTFEGLVPNLQDIPLTLLNAAGFNVDTFGEGRNLLAEHVADTSYVSTDDQFFAVYDQGYKLIFGWQSALGPKSELKPLGLYSQLADGLEEANNLLDTAELAQVQSHLINLANEYKNASTARGMRKFGKQELADLNALGYAFDEDGNAVEK